MATCNFTVKWLESVSPGPAGRAEFFDTHTEGLGLRVGARSKTFFVMPRVLRQGRWRQERISLGRVGEITLAQAREDAKRTLATAAAGQVPEDVGKERRAALVLDSANSFGKVRADFLPLYRVRRGGRLYPPAPRTLHAMTAVLDSLKAWDDRPLSGITRRDIQGWHDGYVAAGKEAAANRYLNNVRSFFRWAKERGIIPTDPAREVVKGGAHHARERVLSHDELATIWLATTDDRPFHHIVRLLLLTGQRREEVAGMAWREVDLTTGLWTLPAHRSKNRRPHLIPLSAPALALLTGLASRGMTGLVFPTRNETPFNHWSGSKAKLDDRLKIAPWRLHDLRRSMVTHMAEDLGILPHVVEATVNHISGFRAGVAGVYNKALYLEERRQALDAWAAHVAALVAEVGQ
jgi:integrase